MLVATILVASMLVFSGVFFAELPRLLGASVPQEATADTSVGTFAVSRPGGKSALPVMERKTGMAARGSPFRRTLSLGRSSCLEEDASVPEKVPEEAPNSYSLEWTGVSVWTDPSRLCGCCGPREPARLLLRGANGSIESQRLAAAVGAGDSGKSELLRFLAGRLSGTRAAESAAVSINGVLMDSDSLQTKVAYMRLEDYRLVGTDTVRETMSFWVSMRLPSQVAAQERDVIVDDMMSSLGLDRCANSPVDSLSAAEMRRAAIGKEIIGAPEAFLLDDVFTGLDAVSALALAATLKELTNAGVPVLTSVDEPKSELFGVLDDVLIMYRGQVFYHGPGSLMSDHFSHVALIIQPLHGCPSDHVLFVLQDNDLRSPGILLKVQDEWTSSTQYSALVKGVESRRATEATPKEFKPFPRRHSFFQFRSLCCRELMRLTRDLASVAFHLTVTIICGLLLAGAFYGACSMDDDPALSEPNCADGNYDEQQCIKYGTAHLGAGMVVVLWLCVDAVFPVLMSVREPRCMLLELGAGDYSASAGLLAKICVQAIVSFAATVLFWTSVYLLMGWQGNFLLLVLVSWGLQCYIYALVLTAACYIVDSTATEALLVFLLITLPMVLFGGVLLPLDALSVGRHAIYGDEMLPLPKVAAGKYVQFLLPFKYAYQLIMTLDFQPVKEDIDSCLELYSVTNCMADMPGPYTQQSLLQDRHIYWEDWPMSMILFVVVTLFHLCIMSWVLRRTASKRR